MLETQNKIRNALLLLVSEDRKSIDATVRILKRAHNTYFDANSHLYSENEVAWIDHFLDSVILKYSLATISIGQLQAVRLGKADESLWPAFENSISQLDISDDEKLIESFALESFLFEGRAFLDVFMIYVCLLLKTGFGRDRMSRTRFFQELEEVTQLRFAPKAKWVSDFFTDKVFGVEEDDATIFRNDWGKLLTDLRDRVAHRDKINYSFQSKETFINEILLNWPTVKGVTYHLLTETIRNGMQQLFYVVSAHIYEINWDDYRT